MSLPNLTSDTSKTIGNGATSLFLIAEIAGYSYAIPTGEVVEVTPYLELRPLPTAVRGIAGVMNFRGQATPVVDLALAVGKEPVGSHFSARIVVIRAGERNIGLLAEKVIRTFRAKVSDFQETGIQLPEAPFLGPVWVGDGGPIQWIDPMKVLPVAIQDVLFSQLQAIEAPEVPG